MRLRIRPHGTVAEFGRLTVARPASWRDRAVAHVWARELDSALAAGTPSEASAALAYRARQLTSLSQRRTLADTYRRIVRDARENSCRRVARVATRRREVDAAREELVRLAETLARPGPVSARGAAEARLLLIDGAGPLYNPGSEESLRARALSATENLLLAR